MFNTADANYSQAIDIGDGLLKVKADGTYSFTADTPVIGTGAGVCDVHGDGRRPGHGGGDGQLCGYGRERAGAGKASAAVDDDGLSGPPAGNPASTTGDLDANLAGDTNTSEAVFTGVLGGSVGPDGAGANGFSFAPSLNGSTAVVGLETVTYSVVSNLLTATVTSGTRVRDCAVHGCDHGCGDRGVYGDAA